MLIKKVSIGDCMMHCAFLVFVHYIAVAPIGVTLPNVCHQGLRHTQILVGRTLVIFKDSEVQVISVIRHEHCVDARWRPFIPGELQRHCVLHTIMNVYINKRRQIVKSRESIFQNKSIVNDNEN